MRSPPSRSTSATCRSSWPQASLRKGPDAGPGLHPQRGIHQRLRLPRPGGAGGRAGGVRVGAARSIRSRRTATCCGSPSRRRRRAGRPGRPLNLVLLLDNSGSMERADRVADHPRGVARAGGAIAAAGHGQRRHLRAHGAAVGGRRARQPGRRRRWTRSAASRRKAARTSKTRCASPTKPRCGITSPTASTAWCCSPTARPTSATWIPTR